MRDYYLYTYSNVDELKQYLNETGKEINNFVFGETSELLKEEPYAIVDITSMTLLCNINKENRYYANNNLVELTEDSIVLIEEAYVDIALRIFPYFFSESKPIYPKTIDEKISKVNMLKRNEIFTYSNDKILKDLVEYCNHRNIPISSFPIASGLLKANYEEYNKTLPIALVDISSTILAIDDNKNIIYLAEQFFGLLPNISIIIKKSLADRALEYFPLFFSEMKSINLIFEDFSSSEIDEKNDNKKHCITNISEQEFEEFSGFFCNNLIGHTNFKNNFLRSLSNFRTLNSGGEQRVFSAFLFGKSGIGKTEVARLIHEFLGKDTYFAKINFANYSSQDAINSLIGSPAGYVGCNHGELSEKVAKSKIGLILCDEFEKTTRPVFSFFLELLEDGSFTDSLAREYDINGFIIVFTSNILNESDYKKIIPQELQTRFDLVCEFEEPSPHDKKLFLDLLFTKAEEKFSDLFEKYPISEEKRDELFNFDYKNTSALRDIRREFNYRLMDYFNSRKEI